MLYLDRTEQCGTRVLHVPSPSRKMARRLARIEAMSLDRLRNWVATHSLLQAVLLWLGLAMAVIWRKQDSSGPADTINDWFVGLAAGGVVTIVVTVAMIVVLLLAAIVIDIALSDDGDDKPDQPLGFKAFINSCQPLAIWCVACRMALRTNQAGATGYFSVAMSGGPCGHLAVAGTVESKVHLRYMATGVLAQVPDCPRVRPGL